MRFYRGGKKSTERLGNLPTVTKLVKSTAFIVTILLPPPLILSKAYPASLLCLSMKPAVSTPSVKV